MRHSTGSVMLRMHCSSSLAHVVIWLVTRVTSYWLAVVYNTQLYFQLHFETALKVGGHCIANSGHCKNCLIACDREAHNILLYQRFTDKERD